MLLCVVGNKNTLETVQYGVEGSTTFLECQARSPHVSLKWHLQKENSDRRKEVNKRFHSKTVPCLGRAKRTGMAESGF